jgi:alkylation response protein AidB-like acyl-CoA dehydrogenase
MTAIASVPEQVRALAPELSERALESERLAAMPVELVDRIRAAGLFGMGLPRELGGLELEPSAITAAVEELSRADGSAGWTVLIGNATAFLAWLEPVVARDLLAGRSDVVAAACFGPTGRLVSDEAGRHRLTGRWPFSSGCRHADWFATGAFVFDGEQPRRRPDGSPDTRLAFVPAADVRTFGNWDAAGLRGTGSDDIAVAGAVVPDEYTINPFAEPARFDGALYRLPFFTLIGVTMAGFPLGVGRRALDEFTTLARTKIRPGSTDSVATDGDAQVALAQAEGALRAARSFVYDALGSLWESALRGDVPDVERRAGFLLAVQQAMRAGVDAARIAFEFSGAGAVYADHPLQRCLRDIQVARQHIYFAPSAAKRYAKVRFGIDQPTNYF